MHLRRHTERLYQKNRMPKGGGVSLTAGSTGCEAGPVPRPYRQGARAGSYVGDSPPGCADIPSGYCRFAFA